MGNAAGTYEEVDCDIDGSCWGESLRVKIKIDVTKSIRRGIRINIDGPIGGCWIPMKYKRLPNFCFQCGIIGHVQKDCFLSQENTERKKGFVAQYGTWLRFQGVVKGTAGARRNGTNRSASSNTSESSRDWSDDVSRFKRKSEVGEGEQEEDSMGVVGKNGGGEDSDKLKGKRTNMESNLLREFNATNPLSLAEGMTNKKVEELLPKEKFMEGVILILDCQGRNGKVGDGKKDIHATSK